MVVSEQKLKEWIENERSKIKRKLEEQAEEFNKNIKKGIKLFTQAYAINLVVLMELLEYLDRMEEELLKNGE